MSSSSLREPKAPIVRIRKKKTKKKTKENDIVHLPVRASQQARYSSLSTPRNPQPKGRECCRTVFASCLKLPVCKTICFRCILPQCYRGEGSDDEEPEARDEGYHSQNRHSSELPVVAETQPTLATGIQGAAGGRDEEMTELKTESVKLVPPPRRPVNDYRRGPSGSRERLSSAEKQATDGSGEITYIEVESISFQSRSARSSANDLSRSRECSASRSSASGTQLETDPEGYEEPIIAGVLGEELSVGIERELKSRRIARDINDFLPVSLTKSDASKGSKSEMSECDVDSDDSETKYYVNEDILKRPAPDTGGSDPKLRLTKTISCRQKALDYANVTATKEEFTGRVAVHSTKSAPCSSEQASVALGQEEEGHAYINVEQMDDIVTCNSDNGQDTITVVPEGMVKTDSYKHSSIGFDSSKRKCDLSGKSSSEKSTTEVSRVVETVLLPIRDKDDTDDELDTHDDENEEDMNDKKVLLEVDRTNKGSDTEPVDIGHQDDGNGVDLDTDKTKLIG